jgi:diguanylate cyclase (GGDEF)-like protein/PAS domain S-box-containing protein
MTSSRKDDPADVFAFPASVFGCDDVRALLDSMPVMVAVFDAARRLTFGNASYAEFVGANIADCLGRQLADYMGEKVQRAGDRAVIKALRGERVQLEGWMPHPAGEPRFVNRLYVPQRGEDGAVVGYIVFMQDQSDQQRYRDDLFRQAYYDPITSLANRLLMLKSIADHQAEGEPFTLLVVDIDRYANIRASLGQGFTNELLIDLAQRLSRDGGHCDILARISDQAFAQLIGGPPDRAMLDARAETLLSIARLARAQSGAGAFLTASVGVAAWDGRDARPEEVLRNAEIATAYSREGGEGRFAWFDPDMHARIVQQAQVEHDLRHALENEEELWVAYQPIVELVTGGLAGFEALVRWKHPERGNIPPVDFIPIAENTGLIVALGAWVLRQACQALADWQELREPGSAPLFMSVNLSTRQLNDPDFARSVRECMRETGVESAWLKLEITESAVMDRADHAIKVLAELKAMGIKLSLDDFGTGYSSLSYIHKLPVQTLKVDRSFVSVMHESEENRGIVRIIIDLARLFGFDVVAEGIETEADAHLLRALACDYGQGYLYARPMAPAEAVKLLEEGPTWRHLMEPDRRRESV